MEIASDFFAFCSVYNETIQIHKCHQFKIKNIKKASDLPMRASQNLSSSSVSSDSVGSTIIVPTTGQDVVGAWKPGSIKDGLSLKIKNLHIHLYFIATQYL